MSFRVALVAFAVVMMSVASFGLQFGSNEVAMGLMDNSALQWGGCNETTCEGPIHVFWNATECRGKPMSMVEILRFDLTYDKCLRTQPGIAMRVVSTSSAYEEHEYLTSDCTGPKFRTRARQYRQCVRDDSHAMASFRSVQDFLEFEGAPAMNPDGVPKPGLSAPLYERCTPGSCNDAVFQAQWGDGTSCSNGGLSEMGWQLDAQPGVCYNTSQTNVRYSCLHSELRIDSFIFGCTGTPLMSSVFYMDQQRSSASVAVGYCGEGNLQFMACRNPSGAPSTSGASYITLSPFVTFTLAILMIFGL